MLKTQKDWYNDYPEILHLDGTYGCNAEDYVLFSMVAQNSSLQGLPIFFSLLRNETNENVEFVYESFKSAVDTTKNQSIFVDKVNHCANK
jgi:hypothetical protein